MFIKMSKVLENYLNKVWNLFVKIFKIYLKYLSILNLETKLVNCMIKIKVTLIIQMILDSNCFIWCVGQQLFNDYYCTCILKSANNNFEQNNIDM